jgi:hypothetical protein
MALGDKGSRDLPRTAIWHNARHYRPRPAYEMSQFVAGPDLIRFRQETRSARRPASDSTRLHARYG